MYLKAWRLFTFFGLNVTHGVVWMVRLDVCGRQTLTRVQVYILYCAVVLSNSEPLEQMTHSYGFGVVFIGVGGFVTTCSMTSLM